MKSKYKRWILRTTLHSVNYINNNDNSIKAEKQRTKIEEEETY